MGINMTALKQGDEVLETLEDRIYGRVLADDVIDYSENADGEVLANAGTLVDDDIVNIISKHNIEKVKIRSVLTCESKKGVCAKCYGQNLSTRRLVSVGEAVGIIAAQSIGEPGTQLTLRTFHVGGSADIALVKSEAIANYDGVIKIENIDTVNYEDKNISIRRNGSLKLYDKYGKEAMSQTVPYAAVLYVKDGDKVKKNQKLFSWDPFNSVIIAHVDGKIRFKDILEKFGVPRTRVKPFIENDVKAYKTTKKWNKGLFPVVNCKFLANKKRKGTLLCETDGAIYMQSNCALCCKE